MLSSGHSHSPLTTSGGGPEHSGVQPEPAESPQHQEPLAQWHWISVREVKPGSHSRLAEIESEDIFHLPKDTEGGLSQGLVS